VSWNRVAGRRREETCLKREPCVARWWGRNLTGFSRMGALYLVCTTPSWPYKRPNSIRSYMYLRAHT